MKFTKRLVEFAPNLINKSFRLNGKPFDPDTPIPPPSGYRRNWVHYGVMIPDLPAPHHTFNVLSIIGTPGATVFDNDFAVKTSPQDTAYLLSTMASMKQDQFRTYSIAKQCKFADDGSRLQFGDDLIIEGHYPQWTLVRCAENTRVKLSIGATQCVTHFANIPGMYTHWSLLSRYSGTIVHHDESVPVSGLCTFEYAAGMGRYSIANAKFPARHKIPLRYFTYQVLNLNESTQLLLVVLLGPGDLPLQKAVYLRSLDDYGCVYTRNVDFNVKEFQSDIYETPDGAIMRLPRKFTWYAENSAGETVLSIECSVKGEFQYGLGAGYTSWFEFEGTCDYRTVSGTGYLEFIDRR